MRDPVEFTLSDELHCFKRHARISERKKLTLCEHDGEAFTSVHFFPG